MMINKILDQICQADRSMAILLDPEKISIAQQLGYIDYCKQQFEQWVVDLGIDFYCFFIGGSTMSIDFESWVAAFKNKTSVPIIIFPGSHHQLSEQANALLFLQLISGRNPDFLIEQQVHAAGQLYTSLLEIIPTGYVLIDGGIETAVARQSQTTPMSQDDIVTIVQTAYASQLLGHQLVYLEAGSGAQKPVDLGIIKAVNNQVHIPIVVGGGLRNFEDINQVFLAGASMVVVGTAVENKLL